MSLRWRATGELLCARMHAAQPDDTYIDDRIHYQIAVLSRAITPDANSRENGLWHWVAREKEETL